MIKVGLRKVFVAFAALVSVMIIAYFYLLVLVPGKEDELNSRGLRILAQIEQNILEKKTNAQKTLDGVYSTQYDESTKKFKSSFSFFKGLSVDPDSILRNRKRTGNKYGNFNPIYNAATDKWQLQFFGKYGQNNWLAYRYDLDDFLRDVLFYLDDFFEDYIVLHNGKVIYQTSSLAYAGFKIGAVDSVNKKSNRYPGKFLLGDHVIRDTLGGKNRFVFVHPFNHATDLNIVLCGIISTEKYNSEKYLLNTTQIIWVTLVFVLAAFSLPIIKLVTVSEFERLSQYDVLRIGIALTAGSSVLSVCFLLWAHNASQYNRQSGVTRQVAQSLENRVMGELEEISRQWDCQVEMLYTDSLYVRWIRDGNREVSTSLNRSDFHHQVETFVLLNEKGQGMVFDMRENGLITQFELNERDYFKAFQKKNPDISTYLGKDSTTTFYLQPIYSWLDQQNTVVMSKALDPGAAKNIDFLISKRGKNINDFGTPIAFALETHMFSLIKPALLSDVSFCILDKSGKVLFHSDEKRNLRENFIEETGNDPLIREVIANHIETTLQVQYYGGEHVTHFRPMEFLPYTIVVLYDTSFFMEALSNQATFALLMLITLGLMLTLIIVVAYFVTSPQNILRRQRLGIKWLYFNASNRTAFINLFCRLWLPVLLSILFMKGENIFFLSFFLPLFTLALSAGVVYDANMDNYKAGFYENYVKWQYHVFLWICAGLGLLFLAIVFRAGVSVFSGLVFISVEATMIGLAIKPDILPMIRIGRKWNGILGNHPDRHGWGKYMAVPACLLLLFNFSFFPALNFFSLSVRQEREIKQKRNSLELAEGIDAREQWLLSKNTNRPVLDLLRTGIYMPGGKEAVAKLGFNQRPSVAVVPERNEFLSLYNRIVNVPNISYSNSELKTSFSDLNLGKSAEGRWKWILPDTLDYRYRHNPLTDSLTFVPIVLAGGKTIIQCLTVEDWSKIMIGVVASLVLLSVILAFVHKKITLFEYFSSGPEQRKVRRAEKKYIRSSIQYNAKNLLILSLRGSGVTKYIKKFCFRKDGRGEKALDALSKANIEYQYLECVNSKHNHSIVLLPYFELKDSDSSLLCKQLSALNECFKSQELKVVWIAASDPCEQVSLLGKRSLALMKNNDEESNKGQKDEKDKKPASVPDADKLKQERNDILGILNDFEKVTYSLEDNLTRFRTDGAGYFIEEFEFGSYLQNLGAEVTGKWGVENSPILSTYFKYKRRKPQSSAGQQWSWQIRFSQAEEHFILKIQDMAQNYYYSVWAGLSTREKYVLYDFASDEITNYRNFGILSALVRKGLLYYDDRVGALRVMSRSFRNFILTVVDKNEALQLEKEINISGTWETLRIVLVIFLIAIAIFLFATEKTTFNRVIGFITAIASIGPLLIAFVSNLKGLSFGK